MSPTLKCIMFLESSCQELFCSAKICLPWLNIHIGPDGSKVVSMCPSGYKWVILSPNGSFWVQVGSIVIQICPCEFKGVQRGPNWSKLSKQFQIGQKIS